MEIDTNLFVDLAVQGDSKAIDGLIKSVNDRIYTLAVKMLYFTCDAEDATQEILIKILTRLRGFRQESSFQTWAMKIASNHILTRLRELERRHFTFQSCEDMIIRDMPDPSTLDCLEAEQGLVVAEMRFLCVQGLFQCLDRNQRIAYILSETLDVTGPEGADILGITPDNFRKRVSRARKRLRNFMVHNCEWFEPTNPCKCKIQAAAAIKHGIIDPKKPQHIRSICSNENKQETSRRLRQMEIMSLNVARLRAHPDYSAPLALDVVKKIRDMMDIKDFRERKTSRQKQEGKTCLK